MRKLVFISAVAVLLCTAGASSSQAQVTRVTDADRSFMTAAAEGGAAEVALGRLAATRAANQAVRQFGERMIADHGAANAQLQALATAKGVDLPREPGIQQRATYERLAALSGQE